MSHFPVNHHLRPLYRFLAFLAGAYCIVFGAVGVARTHTHTTFAQGPMTALGLRTNLAFSVLSIVVGAVVIVVIVLGRNIDRAVNMVLGPVFLLVGCFMMLLLETNSNFLNFGMSTCIVSFVIGLVLLTEAFYAEVPPRRRDDDFARHRARAA